MKYLLDTHYILWTLFQPEMIKDAIKEILENDKDIKIVSTLSLWEISLKYSLGKLELKDTNPTEIHEKIIDSGFEISSIEDELFSSYYKLPRKEDHKDPFDRMLIWQAISKNYTLITKDRKIEQYIKDGLKIKIGI